MIIKSEKGQSLVESLIALGAAALVVSAMAIAIISAVNSSDFSKYQNLATHYAQQGIEILRQKSQSNWTSFSLVDNLGTYCLGDDNALKRPEANCPITQPTTPNLGGFFIRRVGLEDGTNSCPVGVISGVVRVWWTDGKCKDHAYCHNVEVDSCFTNLNVVPTL